MPPTESTSCADCGHEAPSRFCPHCGQRQDVHHRDLIALVCDFLGDVFTFDSKVFVSLRWLLLKPGWLTLEYIAGRRTRYVTPLRLYLFFSVVFFLLFSVTSGAATADEHTIRLQISGPSGAAGSESVLAKLPWVLLALVPVFAWLLKLAHRRRREVVYMDHLVCALHVHAAGFVVASLILLVRFVWPADLIAAVWASLFLIWAIFYQTFALRRILRQRPLVTLSKVVAITVVHGVLAISISFLTAAWILARGGGGTLLL
jgi:Protein of unknown function (DUF3667)